MGFLRVTWGMGAGIWFVMILLACSWWGWPAVAVALVFGLLPDLALIGAASGEKGKIKPSHVRLYNTLHSMFIPIPLLIVGAIVFMLTGAYESGVWQIALAGLAWFVHVAADRAFGLGFRDLDGSIIPVQ